MFLHDYLLWNILWNIYSKDPRFNIWGHIATVSACSNDQHFDQCVATLECHATEP